MLIDRWMKAAMADDTLVAQLLLRIKKDSKPVTVVLPPPPPPLRWGTKQPRSRITAASRSDVVTAAAVSRKKDEADSTRYSPTTPLSWSGGASPSTTADGNEDSSRHTVHSNRSARSKATATGEYTGNSASTKKCKRKKTFAELMQEESSLLKERIYLREEIANKNATFNAQRARNERLKRKKEIANKNATFNAQRARNESLKRKKLDLGSIPLDKPSSSANEHLCTLYDQPHQRIVPSRALTNGTEDDTAHPQAADSKATRTLLPDLNMMPSEDDSYTDVPCGTS